MDDLEKYIRERDRREPGFERLVTDAEKRQAFARTLAEQRRSSGKTQTHIAALMETSASIVSRLESGSDVRVSTLEKYVAAIGMELDLRAVARTKAKGPSQAKRAAAKRAAPRKGTRAAAKRR